MRAPLALAAALQLACSGEDLAPGDPDLFAMRLEVESVDPQVERADFRERLRATIAGTAAHLGFDVAVLRGVTLRLVDGRVWCGEAAPLARGCVRVDRFPLEVEIAVVAGGCIEESPLPHELLHVAIGDPRHADARWWNPDVWGPLWDEIRGEGCAPAPFW